MLPLSLLNAARGSELVIELKLGDVVTGKLVSCDAFMNLLLRDVVQKSVDGKNQKEKPEMFVKGTFIKYVGVSEQLLDDIKEERQTKREEMRAQEWRESRQRN